MNYSLTWENLKKFTAFLSAVIIGSGFTSLFIYYNYFHIDIFEYLNTSEVVTTSFSFLVILFLPIVFSFFIVRTIFIRSWIYRPNKKISDKYFSVFSALLLLLFILVQGIKIENTLLSNGFRLLKYTVGITYIFFGFFYANSIEPIPLKDSHLVDRSKIVTLKSVAWIAVPLLIVYFIIVQWSNINSITHEKAKTNSTFHLSDDSTITTNDSIKYLGKTEGYYFLWNKKTKVSTIYPTSAIKRIDIK